MHLRFLKTNKQDLLVARHNVKEVVDYFYLCHFQATLTSYCAQKKNTKPRMYIKKHPKCQMNQEVPKQSLFESVWPKCTYCNDIFKLFLSSFKTFFYFTNFFCFITTRFLFYWFLLPWKGKYFAKYLKSEWYLLPISVE